MNEAIKRILARHYGGNVNHPNFQRMLQRLQGDPEAQGLSTKLLIQQKQRQGLFNDLGYPTG